MRPLVGAVAIFALACRAEPPATAEISDAGAHPAAAAPVASLTVSEFGIGKLRGGMSIAEASEALVSPVSIPSGTDSTGCATGGWKSKPDGVSLMIEGLRVVRVDVTSVGIATTEGARVGDSEARIRKLYGARVSESPHKYTNGKYLTVTPLAATDSAFRLIFEIGNGRVTRYRSGIRPQVEYVEGCG